MQNEEKKENKLKRFWYKHGDKLEAIGAGVLIFGGTIFASVISYNTGFLKGHKLGFKSGINKGINVGHKGLQLFIKKEVPEAYKMIDDYIISEKNVSK